MKDMQAMAANGAGAGAPGACGSRLRELAGSYETWRRRNRRQSNAAAFLLMITLACVVFRPFGGFAAAIPWAAAGFGLMFLANRSERKAMESYHSLHALRGEGPRKLSGKPA